MEDEFLSARGTISKYCHDTLEVESEMILRVGIYHNTYAQLVSLLKQNNLLVKLFY